MKTKAYELNEIEQEVMDKFRIIEDHGFGDQFITLHKRELIKNWTTIKHNTPKPKFREVAHAGD